MPSSFFMRSSITPSIFDRSAKAKCQRGWRRLSFTAIFRKEFLHLFRDRGSLRLIFLMPAMQLCMFAFIDRTVHEVPTNVVDQDRTAESRLLIDGIRVSKTFKVTFLTASPEEARAQVREGKVRVALLIPPRYHDRCARRDRAQVLVLIDGSDSTVSSQALASINGLVAQENLARRRWPCAKSSSRLPSGTTRMAPP